jgi:hypothetical protein
MAQDRVQSWALVNMLIKLHAPKKVGNLWQVVIRGFCTSGSVQFVQNLVISTMPCNSVMLHNKMTKIDKVSCFWTTLLPVNYPILCTYSDFNFTYKNI